VQAQVNKHVCIVGSGVAQGHVPAGAIRGPRQGAGDRFVTWL
jgi:hypothetical protein